MRAARRFVVLLLGASLAALLLYPRRPSALLELEPARVSDCDTPTRATVHWDASKTSPAGITLEISQLGQASRIWLQTVPAGTEETGAWLQDGDSITLRDANNQILVRRTLTTTPCQTD